MKEFLDDLLVMPVSITQSAVRNCKRVGYGGAVHSNDVFDDCKIGYLNELNPYIKKASQNGNKGFFLIAERKVIARKAAVYILNHIRRPSDVQNAVLEFAQGLEIDPGLEDDLEELFANDKVSAQLEEIELKTLGEEAAKLGLGYDLHEGEENMPPDRFITGLEDGDDTEAKMNAIRGFEEGIVFVWITPEMAELSIFYEMELMEDMMRIRVSEPDDLYYSKLVKPLAGAAWCMLEKDVDPMAVISFVKRKTGKNMSEECIDRLVFRASKSAKKINGKIRIRMSDLIPEYDGDGQRKAWNRLNDLVGLDNVKKVIGEARALSIENLRNKKLRDNGMYQHMIFAGNPGTGKTTVAKLYSECMSECGISNGTFVSVAREDLVGKYVGHSAPKVAKSFLAAKSGVLFVDEAGFFLNRESGGFVEEVLKEFVRYMELMKDVIVIFAMYDSEVDDFLKQDSGLRSRISRIVEFDDYGPEEIRKIAAKMFKDRGYKIDDECMMLIKKGLIEMSGSEGYGNARDIRRCVEASIRSHSIRLYGTDGQPVPDIDPDLITVSDVKNGIRNIMPKNAARKRRIGFDPSQDE